MPTSNGKHGFSSTRNRRAKAEKIKIILDEFVPPNQGRKPKLLDIGTGSGEIAQFLSGYFEVTSIDINDKRSNGSIFNFVIANESLPFPVDTFDVIISNHVIEHVDTPQKHIDEIYRVLKPMGWFYLATPNRLWPWEVHYRVPLAHYLPNKAFHWLMKKTGKYQEDISLQSSWQLKSLCSRFSKIYSLSEKVCQQPDYYRINVNKRLSRVLGLIPEVFYLAAHIWMPTFIFMLQKDVSCHRILWLTSSYPRYENDSASIFLRHLAGSIQQQNFEIHVLSPDHSSVDPAWKNDPVKTRRYKYFFPQHLQLLAYGSGILPNLRANRWLFLQAPFFLISQFISTWRLIRQLKPDMLHAHWIFPQGCVATVLGKWMGIPVIVTAHGGDAFSMQHPVMAKIKRWTVQNCSAWTSNTFATARAVGDNLPPPEIIPMGIDCQQFSAGASFKRSGDKFVLLFVGRLVQKKGACDLITAFSLMDDSLQARSELWIIGDGAERQALEVLVRQLKLTGNVTFYGRVPNDQLPDYYATADIFIAPSVIDSSGDTEGQGVILLEALASGTAIISTKAGGIGEVIEHGKTGLLVEPNDPVDLKNAMERLLMDKTFRDSLAATGESIIQSYDWSAIATKFSRLYQRQLSN